MLEKCVLIVLELSWNQRLGHNKTKLNICHHALTSSTQLQNWSLHVVERTRTSTKCQKMKNARAKRAKILFFIVKYANLWGFCCRRRRGCLSSLIDHRGRQNVVRTSVTHLAAPRVPLFCSYHILTSSVIYYLNRRTATWNLFVKYLPHRFAAW